ncbi:MAG TPA: EamA family transporter [Erysipelotrichaceae bacterium]|nr:EamA family transporter [Erysipelotrichaceae bacterium]
MKNKDGSKLIFIAAVMWSFAGLGAKLMSWNALSIACVRGIISSITIFSFRKKTKPTLNSSTILASISLLLTTTLFMSANKMTTSANAIVLQYTSPIFILILSVIFLKYKPKFVDYIAISLTLVGISLFFIDQLETGRWLGDLVALLSGLAFAGVFFANRLPKANPMDASLIGNMMSLLLFPFLMFDQNVLSFKTTDLIVIVLLGIFQLGIPYILFSLGIKRTEAIKSSIISTIEPILNPIWVFLFLNELPGILSLIGGFIVLATILWYNTRKTRENYE